MDEKLIEIFIKKIECHHSGNGDVYKKYLIGGKLGNEDFEKLLHEVEFDSGKFGTTLFGEKLILYNGRNLKPGEIAALIADCTKEYEIHHVFHSLGYAEIDGERVYVTRNGIFDKKGLVENCRAEFPFDNFSRDPEDLHIKLPESKTKIKELVEQSLSLVRSPKGSARFIGLITLTIAARSVLTHILPIKFIVFFIGDSGNLKSTLAAVQQSFIFPGTREDTLSLNFGSSVAGMRIVSQLYQHSSLVFDDYNTTKMNEELIELLTLEGSKSTPRCTAKSPIELYNPIRVCTTRIITGEHPLNTNKDSRHARVVYFEFPQDIISSKKLTQIQEAAAHGVYFIAMISFIQWILENHEMLEVEVKKRYEQFREKAIQELPAGTHRRLCENAADLFIGLYFFIDFCIEKKYLTEEERNKYLDPYWKRIKRIISSQQKIIAAYEPQGTFARFIKKALTGGRLHLKSQNDTYIDHFRPIQKGEEPAGDFLGYLKDESGDIYIPTTIDLHAVLHVLPKRLQSMIPPSQKSFWKRLSEFGLYIPMESGNKHRLKIAGHSTPVDCYLLHLSGLFD